MNFDYLLLVNKENLLTSEQIDEIENNLISVGKDELGNEIKLEKETYNNFLKLAKYCKENFNIEIILRSGFRSVKKQRETYNEILNEEGKEAAQTKVAPPFASEHHTGLAIDYNIVVPKKISEIPKLRSIYKRKRYAIVNSVIQKFGFILRYPKGKEDKTGYPSEPWHIRNVNSVELATEIRDRGLTLEEYVKEYKKQTVR